jgi:murein DD-endopeptidase MepM/ murein hydrolase activator NlpD
MNKLLQKFIFGLYLLLLMACSSKADMVVTPNNQPTDITGIGKFTPVVQSNLNISTSTFAIPTETIQPPTSTPASNICSPLENYCFNELEEAISNPYHPPQFGSDDPHQGVDFAVIDYGMAVPGNPIQAVMDGTVSMIIKDRFPYGNAVLIETKTESLPMDWLDILDLPDLIPTLEAHSSLTCPLISYEPNWNFEDRSIYILYAHLLEEVDFQVGDEVQCGEKIGRIGQTGNALNPHLHLEVRIGPADARMTSFGHYDTSITPEEMHYYCVWRVSGLFQLIDPISLLQFIP